MHSEEIRRFITLIESVRLTESKWHAIILSMYKMFAEAVIVKDREQFLNQLHELGKFHPRTNDKDLEDAIATNDKKKIMIAAYDCFSEMYGKAKRYFNDIKISSISNISKKLADEIMESTLTETAEFDSIHNAALKLNGKRIPVDFVCQTDGSGYWSDAIVPVHVNGISLYKINDDQELYSETQIFFDPKEWIIDEYGLIYTDSMFLNQFRKNLRKLGFSAAGLECIDYSEQGMQGPDYVSCDTHGQFVTDFVKIFK